MAVGKCARDPSVYVRKCAANALPNASTLVEVVKDKECLCKTFLVKLWPDIGYFVKPLPMNIEVFKNKEFCLCGMFKYLRRWRPFSHYLFLLHKVVPYGHYSFSRTDAHSQTTLKS